MSAVYAASAMLCGRSHGQFGGNNLNLMLGSPKQETACTRGKRGPSPGFCLRMQLEICCQLEKQGVTQSPALAAYHRCILAAIYRHFVVSRRVIMSLPR